MDANTIAAYSAAASAFLSLCALGVAIFVPRSAAKLSEELRKQTSAEDEKKRLKIWVFSILMQERAAPYTANAVQALNLIDVVFADNQEVKDAWAKYYSSLDDRNAVQFATQREYFTSLLKAMASDLKLDTIGFTELNRIYAPKIFVKRLGVEEMQLHVQEAELIRIIQQAAANTTPQMTGSGQ